MNAADPEKHPAVGGGSAEQLRGATPRPAAWCADEPSPEQIELYRRMSPGRRLELAEQLYWSARRLKAAWVRGQHPDWSDPQVAQEVKRIFSNARS